MRVLKYSVDCLSALATVAQQPGYVKPQFFDDDRLDVGRWYLAVDCLSFLVNVVGFRCWKASDG
jgi:hypothetical protein